MPVNVEIVIPYAGGCPHRARALMWLRDRYSARQPAWELTVSEAPTGPWVKARAVTPAIARSAADIVVVTDADVWCDRTPDAVQAVAAGAPWAVPHGDVHRLTEIATGMLLDGAAPTGPLAERPYRGREGGGILVAAPATLRAIPPDPRFVGWGREDQAWGMALWTLLGPPWRSAAPLTHLWHPPQARPDRKRGRPASEHLYRRYIRARRSPDEMRTLLEEAKTCSPT